MGNLCGGTSGVSKPRGEGNRLGGETPREGNANRAAAAAAEARLGGQATGSKSRVNKSSASKSSKPTPNTSASQGKAAGTTRKPSVPREVSEKAAKAAENREKEAFSGLSEEKATELRIRRERESIAGKIQHYYQQANKEPPIGLMASDVATLRKHLNYAKTMTKT